MRIVAFVGPKGCGKDTSANYLKALNIVKGNIKISGPLKNICGKVFNIDLSHFEDLELKETPFEKPIMLDLDYFLNIMNLMTEYTPEVTFKSKHLTDYNGILLTSPRHLLQFIGTEFIRETDINWHLKAAFSPISLSKIIKDNTNSIYASTDTRFINEYEFLKDKGAKFIYVERPSCEEELKNATHQSEKEILIVKEIIMKNDGIILKNSGSIDDLHNNILKDVATKHFLHL